MCQNVTNIYFGAIEMNRGNQAIFVTADIKHNPLPNHIGGRKRPAQFGKILELGVQHPLVPTHQRAFAVRVTLPELLQCFARDDMHQTSISQIEM